MQFTLIGRVNSMKLFKWIKSLFSDDYNENSNDTLEVTQGKYCPECFSPRIIKSMRWCDGGVLEKETAVCLNCNHSYFVYIKGK